MQCIVVSMRRRQCYTFHRRHSARPRYFNSLSASLQGTAPGLFALHGLAFLRGGITAAPPHPALARIVSPVSSDTGNTLVGQDLVD
jgi:hypothetical protein